MEIVARCEKCGREFVSLPRANMRDPFHPADKKLRVKDLHRTKPCGGRLIPVHEK